MSTEKRIFVFGSNLAGRHGKGAALAAVKEHGAIYGQAEGLQGSSYAIPTKDKNLKPLPIASIRAYVDKFLECARKRHNRTFKVTAIGTGLAGYKHEEIAPLFDDAPENCILPHQWLPKLEAKALEHEYRMQTNVLLRTISDYDEAANKAYRTLQKQILEGQHAFNTTSTRHIPSREIEQINAMFQKMGPRAATIALNVILSQYLEAANIPKMHYQYSMTKLFEE